MFFFVNLSLVMSLGSIYNLVRADKKFNDQKLDKNLGLWNGNCGLELDEVCRSSSPDSLNVLVIEALQVITLNKGNIFNLKMLDMGAKYSRPFPHSYRFIKNKAKGAGYAEYFDVMELERPLTECKANNIKVMLQVSLVGVTKMRKRQVILLLMMIWNSFFEGNVDRPFGFKFVFDGLHFVYDKNSAEIVFEIIKGLKRTTLATESEINLIISSSGINKFFSPGIANECDFVIISESFNLKNIPIKTHFVVQSQGFSNLEKQKNIQEKFESNLNFKGIIKKLGQNERFYALKRLLSRNPKIPYETNDSEVSNEGIIACVLIVIVATVIVFIIYFSYKNNIFTVKGVNINGIQF